MFCSTDEQNETQRTTSEPRAGSSQDTGFHELLVLPTSPTNPIILHFHSQTHLVEPQWFESPGPFSSLFTYLPLLLWSLWFFQGLSSFNTSYCSPNRIPHVCPPLRGPGWCCLWETEWGDLSRRKQTVDQVPTCVCGPREGWEMPACGSHQNFR